MNPADKHSENDEAIHSDKIPVSLYPAKKKPRIISCKRYIEYKYELTQAMATGPDRYDQYRHTDVIIDYDYAKHNQKPEYMSIDDAIDEHDAHCPLGHGKIDYCIAEKKSGTMMMDFVTSSWKVWELRKLDELEKRKKNTEETVANPETIAKLLARCDRCKTQQERFFHMIDCGKEVLLCNICMKEEMDHVTDK